MWKCLAKKHQGGLWLAGVSSSCSIIKVSSSSIIMAIWGAKLMLNNKGIRPVLVKGHKGSHHRKKTVKLGEKSKEGGDRGQIYSTQFPTS